MAGGGHFERPKITFDRISRYLFFFRLIDYRQNQQGTSSFEGQWLHQI